MISAMERLAATINGQPTDRIPVFSVLLDQGAREMGMSLEDYYSQADHVAEGQLRLRARYGYDNVWGLFHVAKEAELWGCKHILFAEDGPPNVGHMIISSFEDIVSLQPPQDIYDNPAFAEQRKCLEILRGEVGGRHPICAYVTSSMTMPSILMGMEKWMELLFLGPPELRDMLLIKCSDYVRAHLAALRKAGADVIFYANPFASTDFLPLKLIEKLTLPWMQRDLQGDSMDGLVFFCAMASLNRSLYLAIERVGFRIVYLSPLDDVAAGKQIVAARALTGAAFNDMLLLRISEKEIQEKVRAFVAAGAPGGRFLFGTVLMPWRIPERSIHAMFEAAYKFGAETFP
jgi:uroporphyrinogen-III decarboxylase